MTRGTPGTRVMWVAARGTSNVYPLCETCAAEYGEDRVVLGPAHRDCSDCDAPDYPEGARGFVISLCGWSGPVYAADTLDLARKVGQHAGWLALPYTADLARSAWDHGTAELFGVRLAPTA